MTLRSRLLTVAGLAAAVTAAAYALIGPKPAPIPAVVAQDKDAPEAKKGDHAMFGGTPARNFVDTVNTGISHEFPKSPDDDKVRVLGARVKWKEALGSRAYGGASVAGGEGFVRTHNRKPPNQRERGQGTGEHRTG